MVATTTFQGGGYPGRPYGSFAGKSPSAGNGPHDPGRITELWGWGGPGGRHTFVAKAPVTPTPPPPPVVGGDDFPGGAYRKGERKRRGLERERVTSDAERLAEMQRAYARAMGEDTPAPVVAAVAAAVRPHIAASSDAILPPIEAIDWSGLLRDLGAIAVILKQHQEAVDDEAALTLLLLS